MDDKIVEAIEAAVSEAGQGPALSRRLTAWMRAVTSGNEDVNDSAASARHLDGLYEATALPELLDRRSS